MIVLDQYPVAETNTVIMPTAMPHCRFLQESHAGRRLARIDDARLGAACRLDVASSRCRYSGEPLKKVERDPLAFENAAGWARDERQPLSPHHAIAITQQRLEMDSRV